MQIVDKGRNANIPVDLAILVNAEGPIIFDGSVPSPNFSGDHEMKVDDGKDGTGEILAYRHLLQFSFRAPNEKTGLLSSQDYVSKIWVDGDDPSVKPFESLVGKPVEFVEPNLQIGYFQSKAGDVTLWESFTFKDLIEAGSTAKTASTPKTTASSESEKETTSRFATTGKA